MLFRHGHVDRSHRLPNTEYRLPLVTYKYKYAAFASVLCGAIVIAVIFIYGFVTMQEGVLKIAFIPATIVAAII